MSHPDSRRKFFSMSVTASASKILYTTGGHCISRMKAEAGILHGNILAKPYRPAELRREIERLLS